MARILLVDDERNVHDLVSRVLEVKSGHTVDAVLSGWDALERLNAGEQYALALVDLHMPDLDGPAFVKQMRAAGHALPIVVISGLPRDEVEEAAVALGARDWVKKPFEMLQLVRVCERALAPRDLPAEEE